ncbi:MAG: glycosyltransferase family 4 protein [Flavobacteriia bacterium]|nr:glycosyltransferase family 4 protein [Flavobacteriia bacterium]
MNIQIAYLCGTFSWGGLEMNQLRNADWMNKRGHQVSIICYQNSPIYKFSNLLNIPVIIIEPFNKYYPFRAGKKLSQLLIKNHFTHLIIRSNHDLSIASNVKWRLKNKMHVSFFMEMQFGITKKSIFHTIRYHFFDLWSCPLIWLKKQTESLSYIPKNKIKVIPSGIDLSEFKPRKDKMSFRNKLNLPSDKKIIALIGRLDENKNQLLVLKALKLNQFY